MIWSFLKTMWRWLRGRMNMVHITMIAFRWEVCEVCDHRRRSWLRQYCGVCKCTISPKRQPFNKLAHPCESCPEGNWTKMFGVGCPKEEKTYAIERLPDQSTDDGDVQDSIHVPGPGTGG